MIRKSGWAISILLTLVSFWSVSSWVARALPNANIDYFTFWLSGFLISKGADPYQSSVWTGFHHVFNVTWIPNLIFPYPLPLSLFFIPLARLPFWTSFTAWDFLSMTLILASLLALVGIGAKGNRTGAFIPILAGTIIFRPVLVTLWNGQISSFLLAVLVAILILWEKKFWFQGALLFGVLLLKPTIGLPLAGLFALWLLIQRNWTAIAGMVVGSGIMLILGELQNPNWIMEFLSVGERKFTETFGIHPTLWGLVNNLCRGNSTCLIISGGLAASLVIFLVLVFLIRHKQAGPLQVAALIVPAGILVPPYLWAYDQILLLIPIAWITLRFMNSQKPYLLAASIPPLFSLFALLLLLVASRVGLDIWSTLLPCVMLIFGIWPLKTDIQTSFPSGEKT